jgi:branched-chain amino acid transport system ATP-binding protein
MNDEARPVDGTGADGTGTPVLAVDGVTVRFGGVVAIDDVSFSVPGGRSVGVIGPNGAGKTTLFDVISGVRRSHEGRVRLDGLDVTRRSAAWRARHGLRRTFQRQQVFGALSVRENLLVAQEGGTMRGGAFVDLVGLAGRRGGARARLERVEHALEACHLEAVADVPAGALPIGIARMVELARALVDRPRVLLLDEPTSGLGEAETALMAGVIDRYVAESGCGVLLVEHDVGFVMDRCEHVVVMNLGAVIAEGPPAVVREHQAVREAYLG